jgi:hypothetical protein
VSQINAVTAATQTTASARWASPVLGSQASEILRAARAQGPVSLIATPWPDVAVRPQGQCLGIETDHSIADFDQVPLTGGEDARVTAMFVRQQGIVPLHAGMFMAADTPLIEFVETADSQRFRLLVDGGRLVGLVTLSDLQRLPVYSLLFGLAIAVESLLVEWIRGACAGQPDAWLGKIGPDRRQTIERHFERSAANNTAIDRLSCASFGDEIEAACGLGLLPAGEEQHRNLLALMNLRNEVCHGKEYAGTPDLAMQVPSRVRNADALAHWLADALKRQHE